MAKRKTGGRKTTRKKAKTTRKPRRSAKRPSKSRRAPKARVAKARKAKKGAPKKKTVPKRAVRKPKRTARKSPPKLVSLRSSPARLARERRTLEDLVPTPPSSLDMDRRGSAARTGRAEMAQSQANHASMTPDISAGDVDVNVEDAYFVGDESPGGDNPTPDQEVVDEIGKALGVEYQDAEELRGSDKVADRDKHRWELDPASSEDYKGRK
jgi:hypothetical protein